MGTSQLFADDNNRWIASGEGFRCNFGSTNIINLTMSASTQSATLPTTGQGAIRGGAMFMLTGTQPVLFALDKSGQGGSYTSASNMVFIPANVVFRFRADPADTTIYILQGGTAGVCQVVALS